MHCNAYLVIVGLPHLQMDRLRQKAAKLRAAQAGASNSDAQDAARTPSPVEQKQSLLRAKLAVLQAQRAGLIPHKFPIQQLISSVAAPGSSAAAVASSSSAQPAADPASTVDAKTETSAAAYTANVAAVAALDAGSSGDGRKRKRSDSHSTKLDDESRKKLRAAAEEFLKLEAEGKRPSLAELAREHMVDDETLRRWCSSLKNRGRSPRTGRPQHLSPEDEQLLVDWIRACCICGSSPTIDDVCKKAEAIARIHGKPSKNKPTRNWYRGFRRRHPELRDSQVWRFQAKRRKVTWQQLISVHERLAELMKKLGVGPDRVSNWDESGISRFVQFAKGRRRRRRVHTLDMLPAQRVSQFDGHITFGAFISATGYTSPPFLILKGSEGRAPTKAVEHIKQLIKDGVAPQGTSICQTGLLGVF